MLEPQKHSQFQLTDSQQYQTIRLFNHALSLNILMNPH